MASITTNHIGTCIANQPLSQMMYNFRIFIKREGTDEILIGVATSHINGKIGLSKSSWALSNTGLLYHDEDTVDTEIKLDSHCTVDVSLKANKLGFKVTYEDG